MSKITNEPEIADISKRKLLLTIWTKPKRTLKYILENCPERYMSLLFILGAIAHGISKAWGRNLGDKISTNSMITIIIVIEVLFGWWGYYIFAWILSKMGKWINGVASPKTF